MVGPKRTWTRRRSLVTVGVVTLVALVAAGLALAFQPGGDSDPSPDAPPAGDATADAMPQDNASDDEHALLDGPSSVLVRFTYENAADARVTFLATPVDEDGIVGAACAKSIRTVGPGATAVGTCQADVHADGTVAFNVVHRGAADARIGHASATVPVGDAGEVRVNVRLAPSGELTVTPA